MLRVVNVATPFTAATLVVPASVPPPGLAPIATVMFPVNPEAVLPCTSWAVTCTAGLIAAPAAVLLGCPVNTSCVVLPAVLLTAVPAGSANPPLDASSVYPVPALSIVSPENVATPLTAATVAVPASVPPLGFVPIATVTFPVNPVAVFPCPSRAVTCTAGLIAAPATVLLGCPVNTNRKGTRLDTMHASYV